MIKHDEIPKEQCTHLSEMKILTSDKTQCDECNITAHLRLCTSCGAVHCCESGRNHDRDHYQQTGHPIIKPIHSNYDFTWCWVCNAFLI